MKNKNDLRVVKTRESLVNAYLELLVENASNKVLDIFEKANITPITFYHHFGDRIELQKYVIYYQLQHIIPIPKKLKPLGNKQLFFYLITKLGQFFISNKEATYNSITNIYKKGYKHSYIDVLTTTIEYESEKESSLLKETISPEYRSIIIKLFIGGLLFLFYTTIIKKQIIDINKIWQAIKIFASIINSKN